MSRAQPQPLRALPLAAVALISIAAVVWAAAIVVPDLELPGGFLGDFRNNVWEAGHMVLDGESPVRDQAAEAIGGSPYPPAAVVMTLPFALLPYGLAAVLWTLLLVGSLLGALAICGVRDWRCYVLVLATPPAISGLAYGNVSLALVLALALVWVWRDKPGRAGLVLGLMIAGKLFLWPMLLWFLLTRRPRAAVIAVVSTAVASLIGWAAIGFQDITDYPAVLRRNTSQYADGGDSLVALLRNVDVPSALVVVVSLAVGAIVVAVAWRRRDDDLVCLGWILAATLFVSPLVWTHYYALMLVPLAISTPGFSRAWFLPFLTAPMLTSASTPRGNVIDAGSGVVFLLLTARHVGRTRPFRPPRPVRQESADVRLDH